MLTREQVAGCRATIKTDPKPNRRWRESIFVSALDSIDFLEGKLSSCESCLAEAEREVERLRQEILGCIRLIPTKFVVRDFSERRTEECIEGTLAISISRLNAELVKCQDAQQLLNSEGRAGA